MKVGPQRENAFEHGYKKVTEHFSLMYLVHNHVADRLENETIIILACFDET